MPRFEEVSAQLSFFYNWFDLDLTSERIDRLETEESNCRQEEMERRFGFAARAVLTTRRKPDPKPPQPQPDIVLTDLPTPGRVQALLDMPRVSKETLSEYGWDFEDHSPNITVAPNSLTCYRNNIAQQTDCIRGKQGFKTGLHVWEIRWAANNRGTHAVVGVGTKNAALSCNSYKALVGIDAESWGWELVRKQLLHKSGIVEEDVDGTPFPSRKKYYPENVQKPIQLPDTFQVVLDMNEGTLAFMSNGVYLGVAFRGLNAGNKELFPMISVVWGMARVTMNYLGGIDTGVFSLTNSCRHIIRKAVTENGASIDRISELNLPVVLKKFLEREQES